MRQLTLKFHDPNIHFTSLEIEDMINTMNKGNNGEKQIS
jgi:hypothetical protein